MQELGQIHHQNMFAINSYSENTSFKQIICPILNKTTVQIPQSDNSEAHRMSHVSCSGTVL